MKEKSKTILHCDMNSFYASVELLDRPDLAGKPVAVCGDPDARHGIILAKNETAKKFGVVTAETVWQAKKKCPELVFLKAHHDKYERYFKRINGIYAKFTDLIEPFSIDESWLDVTASEKLFGSGEEIAYKIKDSIRSELGLTQSIGVSYNKIFAKMGSDYKKPDAVTVITPENYRDLLWPLPVRELFSVGNATAVKLNELGIRTIGDLACTDRGTLEKIFGKQGGMIFDYANGYDDSPVRPAAERRKIKSVGNGITFRRDLRTEDDILTALTSLSDTVSGRLRKYGLKCGGVKIDIKDTAFKTITRQQQLTAPTNLTENIRAAALQLMHASWHAGTPIRLITVTGINITSEDEAEQISFLGETDLRTDFGSGSEEAAATERLERTMDEIRDRYGRSSITYGRIIGNDIGIELDEQKDE
ncbi:MAG: DNA polymerase IV [Clostridiales Family XIII bacterium]|jgi:DNA polymerase-4|nr:DNA polymerase IV [Clostridiales Family XIII bacterium]